jgi:hypothetical protein
VKPDVDRRKEKSQLEKKRKIDLPQDARSFTVSWPTIAPHVGLEVEHIKETCWKCSETKSNRRQLASDGSIAERGFR